MVLDESVRWGILFKNLWKKSSKREKLVAEALTARFSFKNYNITNILLVFGGIYMWNSKGDDRYPTTAYYLNALLKTYCQVHKVVHKPLKGVRKVPDYNVK